MTANEFYGRYGQYIHRAQQGNRKWDVFPYLDPCRNDSPNNELQSMLRKYNATDGLKEDEIVKFLRMVYNYPSTNLSAVIWYNKFITFYPIEQGNAVMSFEFAGCYMAKFQLGTQWFACHIHSGVEGDCKNIWKKFQEKFVLRHLILFRPTDIN